MGESLAVRMRTTMESSPSADPDDPGGGFDMEKFFTALGKLLARVAPGATQFDPAALAALVDSLRRGDASGAFAAAAKVASDAAELIGTLPGVDVSLGHLLSAIRAIESFSSGEAGTLLDSLRRAAAGDESVQPPATVLDGIGLAGAIAGGPAGQAIKGLLSLLSPGVGRIADMVGGVARDTAAARPAMEALAGLAAVHTCAAGLATAARGATAAQPSQEAIAQAAAAAAALVAGGLAARLAAVPAGDDDAVEDAVAEAEEYLAALGAALDAPTHGMLGAEGLLKTFDAAAIAAQLETARQVMTGADLAAVRTASVDLAGRLQPALSVELGPPASSTSTFVSDIERLAAEAADLVSALDLTSIVAPASRAIEKTGELATTLADALDRTVMAVRAAFESVRQVVRAVDIAPLVAELRRLLDPVVQAITTIQGLVGQAQESLRTVADATAAAIDELVGDVQEVVGIATGAFGQVADLVAELDLEALVEELRAGTERVASELRKCQLQPYFDAAVDAIDTTATVVDAIPLDLLPDEQKRKLPELTRPIKEIDFQADVADVLSQQLDEILDAVDEEVLAEVAQAFADVTTFLRDEVDPRGHFEAFESEHLAPLLERLRAFDPEEALRPVADALDRVREVVRSLDVDAALAPIEEVFDDLVERLDGFDPTVLVAAHLGRATAARDRVRELIALDRWTARLDEAAAEVDLLIDGLAPDRLLAAISTFTGALVEVMRGPAGIAVLIARPVFAAVANAQLPRRAESLAAAIRWVRGDDGAAAVRTSLERAAGDLAEAKTTIAALAPPGAALQAGWAQVRGAILGLAVDHPLRAQIEPRLGQPPDTRAASFAAHRPRVVEGLGRATAIVAPLSTSDFSEVLAVSRELRDALRPLARLIDAVLRAIARTGITVAGRSLPDVFDDVVALCSGELPPDALRPLIDAVRAQLDHLFRDLLVEPARHAIAEATRLFDLLDPSILERELGETHALIRAEIDGLRPTSALADLLAAVRSLRTMMLGFDPLGPIRDAVTRFQQAVERLADTLKPSALFADLLSVYEGLLALVSTLDVSQLLRPILDELRGIETQLDEGLDEAAEALKGLQAALP
jgi:hypothetical protein